MPPSGSAPPAAALRPDPSGSVPTPISPFFAPFSCSYGVKVGEELLGFTLHVLGVGLDGHHGVEVLRPLQRGLGAVAPQGAGGDEELGAGVLRGNLKQGENGQKQAKSCT